jgi:hypothetical protein
MPTSSANRGNGEAAVLSEPAFSSTDTPPADSRATKVCCKHRGSRGRPNQLGGLDHRPVQPLPAQGVGPPRDRSRRQAACRLTHRRIDQLRGRRRGRARDAVGLGSSPRDQRTRHDGDPVAARVHPGRHRQPPGLDRPAGSQPAHGAWRTRRPVQIPDPRSRQRRHPLLRNRIAVDCETGWKRCRGMTGKPFGTAQCHLRPLRPGDISVTNDLQTQNRPGSSWSWPAFPSGAEGIRTPDPLDANEVRYRTALQPLEQRPA